MACVTCNSVIEVYADPDTAVFPQVRLRPVKELRIGDCAVDPITLRAVRVVDLVWQRTGGHWP